MIKVGMSPKPVLTVIIDIENVTALGVVHVRHYSGNFGIAGELVNHKVGQP